MARREKSLGHLVGAYGLFWDRWLVDWSPGSGPTAWELLGRRNSRRPVLRICNFRDAHGVYVLYNEYGPGYVGLARGAGGIGGRLRSHNTNPPRDFEWTRFCWFAFDDVVDDERDNWCRIEHRANPAPSKATAVIREVEALLIAMLGTPPEQHAVR
jgi:hypothetical protein